MRPVRVPARVLHGASRLVSSFVLNPDLDWSTQRARLEAGSRFDRLPRGTVVAPEVVGGVPAERVSAPGSDGRHLIIHLHGGGYCVGSPAIARGYAARLSALTRAPVLVPDYRLAPESPFPAALDDVSAAWEEVTAGRRAADVVLSGDSAGAGLALALACMLRDTGRGLPAGLVLISPWLDLAADRTADPSLVFRDPLLRPAWLRAAASAYAGEEDPADPRLSPLWAAPDKLPPVLVQSGADDILAPDARSFVLGARAAGVDVHFSCAPGLWHDFALQAGMLAAADSALRQAAAFALERWSTAG